MKYIKFIIDFILHIDLHLAELVAQYGVWVYALSFMILLCETGLVVTPFLLRTCCCLLPGLIFM
ncbi:MAG: Protein DedA [Sodalis sp.]|nr:MAG: Protein DedA [Sodalis sp.]WMQ73321.1 MAG: Protein DedA [Sodalis sp.]